MGTRFSNSRAAAPAAAPEAKGPGAGRGAPPPPPGTPPAGARGPGLRSRLRPRALCPCPGLGLRLGLRPRPAGAAPGAPPPARAHPPALSPPPPSTPVASSPGPGPAPRLRPPPRAPPRRTAPAASSRPTPVTESVTGAEARERVAGVGGPGGVAGSGAARGGAGERARGRMEAGAGGGEGEGRGSGGGGGRMRGLLLRYMLWDALGRPGLWHAALLRDGARAGAWAGVLARAARGQGGPCGGWVALGTPGEVPLVPLLAATAMAEVAAAGGGEGVPVAAVEPVRPVRAALKEAARTNGLGGWLSALSAAPEGREGALYLAPGLEDIAALPGTLETLQEAGSPARVLPSRVVVRALLLELPRQANPVRVPVGSVSGFDLGEFDRFAGLGTGGAHGAGLSHMARLRDLRFRELAAPALLADIRTGDGQREETVPAEGTAEWTSGPLCPQREGVCHAVAVWADALLDLDCEAGEAGPWLDGGPEGSRARRQQLHILPRPVNVRPGEEVRVTYEPRADGGPRLLLFVGGHLAASKGEGEGEECASEAAAAAVERREVQEAQESEAGALQTRVERWHFAMVNDHRRNDAYEAAIREAVARVGPSAHVLDIGAGSGLLGLMAARAGAKGVTGVERVGALAECARAVAAANGLAGVVQVLHAESTAVDSEALAGGHRADLLVSEILDDGLLGEHVLPSVADARARLIAPGAPIIPSAATVWAVAVDCQPAAEPLVAPFRACTNPFAEEGGGLDLTAYDALFREGRGSYASVRLDRVPHEERTEAFRALDFDFEGPLTEPGPGAGGTEALASGTVVAAPQQFRRSREVRVPVTTPGPVNAVAFWFTLNLLRPEGCDAASDLCTYPARAGACGARGSSRCWSQAIQFLERPVECPAGATLRLVARHSATRVQFVLLDVLPPAAGSCGETPMKEGNKKRVT